MQYILILFLSFIFYLPGMAQTTARLVRSVFIASTPVTPTSHASSITALPNGELLVAWFGGLHEGSNDVAIYASRYTNNHWQPPVKIADGISDNLRYPCWNPVLFRTRDNVLCLFYKVGPNPREWWGMAKYSHDNGHTWSLAEKLPDGMLGPIKNKPVQLPNGDLLHPSSTESKDEKQWLSHIEISDSSGHHWRKIKLDCDTFGVIQPTILSYSGNRYQLLFRSRQNVIVSSWTNDQGYTWTPLTALRVKNPNAGIDAVTMPNGLQVLVYNPAISGKEWFNGRNELRVAVSDDGLHWKDVYQLEKHAGGEYSYPAIIATPGNLVHITYTWDRKNIKQVTLKLHAKQQRFISSQSVRNRRSRSVSI